MPELAQCLEREREIWPLHPSIAFPAPGLPPRLELGEEAGKVCLTFLENHGPGPGGTAGKILNTFGQELRQPLKTSWDRDLQGIWAEESPNFKESRIKRGKDLICPNVQ